MKDTYYKQIYLLVKRLALAYLLYFICRLLFFIVNHSFFESVSVWQFIVDSFWGLRFDTFSIVVSNCLFIVLSILPVRAFWKSWYQKLLITLYVICNAVFVAFNLVDVAYYPFIKKRSTSELFDQLGGQTDMGKMLPKFLMDYWWLVVGFIVLVYLLSFYYRKIRVSGDIDHSPVKNSRKALHWASFVILGSLAVLGVRGGFQRVPIDIVNAGAMSRPEEASILLNTPFTLIKSMNQKALPELAYFEAAELKTIYDPVHRFDSARFSGENIVVLILESFSKEYTRLGRTESVTPFLDSLMDHSLVFTNAFSNGTKSIEGIPAILSGLPSLMPNPFINSIYANDEQTSLPYLLKKKGYHSGFFHGGINGTMNFDDWARLAGYDQYFGKNEYNNEADFDGYWGIWDEPFLQYAINKMDGFKQPFHSAVFTLSSHHPYFIPEKYKNRFKKTSLENSESIGYADHSLRLFFKRAKKSAWYKNTTFVLVADHTGISEHPYFMNIVGISSIPVLFFRPDGSLKGVHDRSFSQIDILPSLMDCIGYDAPFFAFGNSYKEAKRANSYLYYNGTQYLFGDSLVYCFNDEKISRAYNFKRDSMLGQDLYTKIPAIDAAVLKDYKAFMQTYHQALNQNAMRQSN